MTARPDAACDHETRRRHLIAQLCDTLQLHNAALRARQATDALWLEFAGGDPITDDAINARAAATREHYDRAT